MKTAVFSLCIALFIPGDLLRAATAPAGTNNAAQPALSLAPSGSGNDFWTQNYFTGNWDGFRDQLKKDGVSFTPVYSGEVVGNPSGGAKQGVISDGLFDLILELDLDAMSGGAIPDTIFHAESFYIYGAGLSDRYVGDFSNTSGIAAPNKLQINELWVQKAFWDKKLTLKAGNLEIDTDFFQSNSAALFLNSTFGPFTLLANNVQDAPSYPLASPGLRFQILPDPRFYAEAGVYELNHNFNPTVDTNEGIRSSLNGRDGFLVMMETGFLLNQRPNDKGLQGAYRIGAFLDTANFTPYASQVAFAQGTGSLQSAGPDYGIYGIIDQQIYAKDSRIISFFVRSGGAPSDINFVDYYVDGGFNFTGFVPGRCNDVAGLAVARSHVSRDFSAAEVALGNPPSSAETAIEGTYKIQLSPWWSVQPDVQYIVTPSGVEGSRNATVLGLRTSVAF